MLRFMMQKLLHKKWMVVSLLIGNILLMAIACSNPMYKNASLQRSLTKQFSDYVANEGVYPAYVTLESSIVKDKNDTSDYKAMDELSDKIYSDLKLVKKEKVHYICTNKGYAYSTMGRTDNKGMHNIAMSAMSGLEDHIKILYGKMYSDTVNDGVIETIVSQNMFIENNLVLDEVLEFDNIKNADGSKVKIKVTGVYANSESNDVYWVKAPTEYETDCFISYDIFSKMFVNLDKPSADINSIWYMLFDYTKLSPKHVSSLIQKTENYQKMYSTKLQRFDGSAYTGILKEFKISQNKSVSTLLILEVPVLILLCVFIFMISRQMLDLEQNEMALLKSRGSSRKQILTIYFIQSVILTLVSMLVGLPLGAFLCAVLGSANGFLEFVHRSSLSISIDLQVILYAIGAGILSILVMVLPVIRKSGVTIVNLKQGKNRNTKALWQRVYLDVIVFLVSIYGLYSFYGRKQAMMVDMLLGKNIDPVLFLCSSVFIISAGLVALRLQPLMVKLVYFAGKKLWRPSMFASFLNIIRNGAKQQFMMVFLILTVALGIYNATVARTILSNAEENIKYINGADVKFKEVWEDNSVFLKSTSTYQVPEGLSLVYKEPDSERFLGIDGVDSVSRVYREDVCVRKTSRDEADFNVALMAINTKEFGETVNFDSTLLPHHINTYLNVLSTKTNAVLLSSNFHTTQSYDIGDRFVYENADGAQIESVVYGFVDYWPSYTDKKYSLTEDGVLDTSDNYLIVANLGKVQEEWGVKPYELWLKTSGDTKALYDYINSENVQFEMFEDTNAHMVNVRNEPLFQGTNGILTMSFIVVLILCSAGFLIYWILSIRQRELLFGVFRAMGMKKGEIISMLINEQIFSSGIAILLGTVIGITASRLFVPLVQIVYSTTEQAVPMNVVMKEADMVRLFGVVGAVICICMVILGILISKIKISQALKLGED